MSQADIDVSTKGLTTSEKGIIFGLVLGIFVSHLISFFKTPVNNNQVVTLNAHKGR